jgi:hypothetical protein
MARGQLVLDQKTHRIRRLWLEGLTQNEVTLDFAKAVVNADPPVTRANFFPGLPRGWDEDTLPVDGKRWDGK